MPKKVRTARGDIVDFDALILKQQIAQAPMSIEVARRKAFIDNKEGRGRGARAPLPGVAENVAVEPSLIEEEMIEDQVDQGLDFENDNPPVDEK